MFQGVKGHAYSLFEFWESKKRLGRRHGSDVLNRRVALRTDYLDVLKCVFGDDD
jgi:hypothetical protein